MNLESVLEMWKKDSVIEQFNLDDTSRNTPALHAKYLELLSIAKLQLKKADLTQKSLLKKKWLYYNGKLTQDQIVELGWEFDPFNGLKVLKGEMEYYYDADVDIQRSEEKILYHKTMIETLTEIVTNLNWRHQTIGNMIKWRQFEAGG
jgi:hypothetical protein|tara:strand:- start:496 stop:939 length:444 start_codon:yes stop_codon:yes gene_type:complete